MPLSSFANFKLVMSRHRKELRGAQGHGLCVNTSLCAHVNTAKLTLLSTLKLLMNLSLKKTQIYRNFL